MYVKYVFNISTERDCVTIFSKIWCFNGEDWNKILRLACISWSIYLDMVHIYNLFVRRKGEVGWTRKPVYIQGICPAQHCVELCGLESCAPPPNQANQPPTPLLPSHLRLSPLAASQRDGPVWNVPRRLCIAKSITSRCQTLCMSIAIHSSTGIIFLLWNTPPISCLLCVDS
jgi:hypothetical protein